MTDNITYFAASDVGCVRSNNEDMAFVAGKLLRDGILSGETLRPSDLPVAFAVADGMGGYEGGEVASEIVCRAFQAFVGSFEPAEPSDTIIALKQWAAEANELVLSTASVRPELAEMGTTFVGLMIVGKDMWLINIGDSRCYRYRQGILKQLSTDHSERLRTGNPDVPSNLIYNYMGNIPEDFISDITPMEPLPGDKYLLCSDGLSDLLSELEIEELMETPEKLVDKAKEAGGRDNVTVVVINL